ncbi:calmodulin [Paragonimus westermani]|uniref:Calmodulin n=1 Tax=Paragonimus westermani TaxID=34504 RepID=A0A5J4NM35_9TREM|nr:calmodulin [Paragonimus westermani]
MLLVLVPDGNMSDVDALIQEFDRLDRNRDGKLSVDEIRSMMHMIGFKINQAEKFMQKHDKNKDGTMSREEYAAAVRTVKPAKIRAARVRQLFRQADRDHSGLVNAAELKNILANLNCQIAERDVDLWIDDYDRNNDGQLNYEEFIKFMKGLL